MGIRGGIADGLRLGPLRRLLRARPRPTERTPPPLAVGRRSPYTRERGFTGPYAELIRSGAMTKDEARAEIERDLRRRLDWGRR